MQIKLIQNPFLPDLEKMVNDFMNKNATLKILGCQYASREQDSVVLVMYENKQKNEATS